MDPCPFVRVLVGNLSLKLPSSSSCPSPAAAGGGVGVHPSAAPCFCKIRLNNLPYQTSSLPLVVAEPSITAASQTLTLAAVFHLSPSDLLKLSASSIFSSKSRIKIAIYTGRRGSTCGVSSGKLLGKVAVPVDLAGADARPALHHNGWATVGKKAAGAASLHLTVRSEPDPRFVFEFGGEPECSPQVFQVQGGRKQPVFTCKFSCRNSSSADRHLRSRSLPLESSISRGWLSSLGSDRERPTKERKGWSVTVHDLSGSPVALASMVTPFVASPGTDRVSRSNPGAWLVLRPGDGTWKPWARLEAWRERGAGSADGLGYRFDLLPDATMASSSGVSLAESSLSTARGGKFAIDLTGGNAVGQRIGNSPGCSPRGSGDFGFGLWPFANYRGFVMSSTVEGEGKCSRPVVEVGVQQVGCTEDAAAFVALAAAVDLSMDACRLFSHRLRKELWQQLEGSGRALFV
ncbi:uncharacterized protein M6B38_205905 [Iris pallida]|uniref:Formin-like protein 18 n=1 Tax=Iris pallida TaxID=29817 RepID=A0AAX6E6S5_IRIPA|nr:uncharacterized protein M6B38_205905 [Iris pallida]